mmetsp:Transcript_35278/g.105395  ORF Transcript_35278/g.105395 Transcript_35278/m.105395 type:complete len:215 (-) Transcript_35278:1925-2569(-)
MVPPVRDIVFSPPIKPLVRLPRWSLPGAVHPPRREGVQHHPAHGLDGVLGRGVQEDVLTVDSTHRASRGIVHGPLGGADEGGRVPDVAGAGFDYAGGVEWVASDPVQIEAEVLHVGVVEGVGVGEGRPRDAVRSAGMKDVSVVALDAMDALARGGECLAAGEVLSLHPVPWLDIREGRVGGGRGVWGDDEAGVARERYGPADGVGAVVRVVDAV